MSESPEASQATDGGRAARRMGRTKEWECSMCTLLNGYQRKTCAACGAARPDAPLDALSQLSQALPTKPKKRLRLSMPAAPMMSQFDPPAPSSPDQKRPRTQAPGQRPLRGKKDSGWGASQTAAPEPHMGDDDEEKRPPPTQLQASPAPPSLKVPARATKKAGLLRPRSLVRPKDELVPQTPPQNDMDEAPTDGNVPVASIEQPRPLGSFFFGAKSIAAFPRLQRTVARHNETPASAAAAPSSLPALTQSNGPHTAADLMGRWMTAPRKPKPPPVVEAPRPEPVQPDPEVPDLPDSAQRDEARAHEVPPEPLPSPRTPPLVQEPPSAADLDYDHGLDLTPPDDASDVPEPASAVVKSERPFAAPALSTDDGEAPCFQLLDFANMPAAPVAAPTFNLLPPESPPQFNMLSMVAPPAPESPPAFALLPPQAAATSPVPLASVVRTIPGDELVASPRRLPVTSHASYETSPESPPRYRRPTTPVERPVVASPARARVSLTDNVAVTPPRSARRSFFQGDTGVDADNDEIDSPVLALSGRKAGRPSPFAKMRQVGLLDDSSDDDDDDDKDVVVVPRRLRKPLAYESRTSPSPRRSPVRRAPVFRSNSLESPIRAHGLSPRSSPIRPRRLPSSPSSLPSSPVRHGWECDQCTYVNENPNGLACAMCAAPRKVATDGRDDVPWTCNICTNVEVKDPRKCTLCDTSRENDGSSQVFLRDVDDDGEGMFHCGGDSNDEAADVVDLTKPRAVAKFYDSDSIEDVSDNEVVAMLPSARDIPSALREFKHFTPVASLQARQTASDPGIDYLNMFGANRNGKNYGDRRIKRQRESKKRVEEQRRNPDAGFDAGKPSKRGKKGGKGARYSSKSKKTSPVATFRSAKYAMPASFSLASAATKSTKSGKRKASADAWLSRSAPTSSGPVVLSNTTFEPRGKTKSMRVVDGGMDFANVGPPAPRRPSGPVEFRTSDLATWEGKGSLHFG
ncbi:hypothetical protein SPRG_00287 [Saprolegnia parasitica CBS 223.65]|uniref:RanBP2-type domain-containing protein n=1 Tax=Saprolegnia parasitica (strain CBS 223.65) TaxID=695850 RepID=A0A067CXJ6_SAPPC|nr:hypothetical protein SPRG_00287 [Saprolegnia parasitica CBS 223.65]KDO35439.1 hypothetical protein SPRG_00287 [Saprolegnia parasitica CBS 223.65]|eukprot:XP_012193779.1 hypothetical protein SPRG_00287 [Saprolegnia parasitica CBS 223.65]